MTDAPPTQAVALNIADIQHIWIAIEWARIHGLKEAGLDDKYLHAVEAKLTTAFDSLAKAMEDE